MAENFPKLVYLPCYQTFARPITVTARGIYDTEELDIEMPEGDSPLRRGIDAIQHNKPKYGSFSGPVY